MSEAAEPADPAAAGDIRPTDPRLRQLTDLRAGNQASLARLKADGLQFSAAGLRLEVLLESIFTPEDRLVFELAYESRLAGALEAARQQVARAKLTQGLAAPNGATLKRPR